MISVQRILRICGTCGCTVDSDKISSTQEYHSTGSGLTRRAARVQRAEPMQVQAPRHGCTIADDPDPVVTKEPTEGTNVFHYVQLTLTDTEIPTADSGTST